MNFELKSDFVTVKFDVAEDSVLPLHPEIIRNIHMKNLMQTLKNKINPNVRCTVVGHNLPPPPNKLNDCTDFTRHNVQ